MIKLSDYEEIQQAYMLYLGENNLIKEAVFVGCSVDGENGFLLKVVYESEGKSYQGILYKKRGGVKLFHTPVVIFRTASLFSIKKRSER